MKSIFFYGLFMDESILKEKGFHPTSPVLAYIDGYCLRIGERATLIKSTGQRAFGAIMDLSEEELNRLYSDPSVVDYIPEQVIAHKIEGGAKNVLSYNLPKEKLVGKNKDYAISLSEVAKKIGLPQSYINEVDSWSK